MVLQERNQKKPKSHTKSTSMHKHKRNQIKWESNGKVFQTMNPHKHVKKAYT